MGALAATPFGGSLAISSTGGAVDTTLSLQLRSLGCEPEAFDTPGETVCTVSLTGPAPPSGAPVLLASGDPRVTVPSGIAIPAGASSASFRATAGELLVADAAIGLTAAFDGSTAETTLSLAGVHPVSLSCDPSSVRAGGRILCAAQLSSSHSAGPVSLALSSSSPDVMVPETITVRSGQPNATFQALTASAAARQSLSLSVVSGDSAIEETIGIVPQSAPVLSVPREQFVAAGNRIAFRVTAVDPGGSAVTLAADGLPAGALFDAGTGEFSWTPGTAQLGSYTIKFTATNAAAESSTADVAITVCTDMTLVLGLAHSASFQTQQVCSPGSLASIFGANFTRDPPLALSAVPAPTELNGVRVRINGQYVALLFVSANQINFQCPQLQPGSQLNLVVEGPSGSSEPVLTAMREASPGIFAIEGSGAGQGAILLAGTADLAKDRNILAPGQPAWPGDIVSIYASGLGPADEVLDAGQAAPADRLIGLRSSITVLIGGFESEVLFAGLAPTLVGIGQINARIPENVPIGSSVPLSVVVTPPGGQPVTSNVVTLAIERKP